MLNRLYIVIGILAILVLGAGFIVPRLMDWNEYRSRLEVLAEANLGTDVIIGGQIEFTLLPQPKIRFGKTIIGPAFSPLLEIDSIEADFSLMDFLRDRFVVTKLVLVSPRVNVSIDKSGNFDNPLTFPETLISGNVSVANAQIVDGSFTLIDKRSGQVWRYQKFEGELSVSDVGGPFGLKGEGEVAGQRHALRLNISAKNQLEQSQASFFWRPVSGRHTLLGEGVLEFVDEPKFTGEAVFRGEPIFGMNERDASAGAIFGDFVVSGQVEVSSEKLLFSSFELQPDENMAGSRLSGAAVVHFGEKPNFDAIISGGVVSLAPLDIIREEQGRPNRLLEWLKQLPPPLIPAIPGRIGVDIAEVTIQGVALRNVRLDASSKGDSWDIEQFLAEFSGGTKLQLSGKIFEQEGRFVYGGQLSLQTLRMGALAQLWTNIDETSFLHNSPGVLTTELELGSGLLTLNNGSFVIDGKAHQFGGKILFSDIPEVDLDLQILALDERQSANLFSLLPDLGAGGAALSSFPKGRLDVMTEEAVLFGMSGKSLAVQLQWDHRGVQFDRLSAFDLGGAQFSLSGNVGYGGSLTGGGRITLARDASSGFLPWLSERFDINPQIDALIERSLPLDIYFDMSPAHENGMQLISAEGQAGSSNIEMSMNLEDGLVSWFNSNVQFSGTINNESADVLLQQLINGMDIKPASQKPVEVLISARGVPSQKLDMEISATTSDEYLRYSGTMELANLEEISGQGRGDFSLMDFAPIQSLLGMSGVFLPGASGSMDVDFNTGGTTILSNIEVSGLGNNGKIDGQIIIEGEGQQKTISGQIGVDVLGIEQIFSTIASPASLIKGDAFWPEGPIDLGYEAAKSEGRIEVSAKGVFVGEHLLASNTSFDLVWDASSISLENIFGESGEGEMQGGVTLCCSILEAQKQLSGRLSFTGVPVLEIMPEAIGKNFEGSLDAGVIFEATGSTFNEVAASFNGEGSFSLSEAVFMRLDPEVFTTLAASPRIGELDGDGLATLVEIALDQGNFEVENASGVFSIAAGKVRVDNVVLANSLAQLRANLRIDLVGMGLVGNWVLSPAKANDLGGLIDESSVQILADIGGSLMAPTRTLNMAQMVDAIALKALEAELDQLEALRAEQVARSAELAANRARLMELDAERKQEEARLVEEAEEAEQLRHSREEAAAAAATAAQSETEQAPLVFELDSQDPLLLQEQLFLSDPLGFNTPPVDLLAQ